MVHLVTHKIPWKFYFRVHNSFEIFRFYKLGRWVFVQNFGRYLVEYILSFLVDFSILNSIFSLCEVFTSSFFFLFFEKLKAYLHLDTIVEVFFK